MKSNSYSIGAKNGLLEQKHLVALGNALWLYLWFLDKQPKNTDKVLGGQPITYQMFAKSFPDVPRRTYVRWLGDIKAGGYIELLRTPKGSVITINKPKKWFDSDAPKTTQRSKSDAPNMATDAPNMAQPRAKYGSSNIKETKLQLTIRNNKTRATKSPEHEQISKLFYEAIKALKLPVLNHTTINAKIKALVKEDEPDKIIKYLEFMRDQYETLDWSFKPAINTALDIYTKRLSIRNTFAREVKDQTKAKGRVFSV